MRDLIQTVEQSAKVVRSIIVSKENYVWPCTMSDLKMLFGEVGPRLGSRKVECMLNALEAQGVKCYGVRYQQNDPVILYLADCCHARCLTGVSALEHGLDSDWSDFDDDDD